MLATPWTALLVAGVAAYLLAVLSAVAGFGGGVLLLPVFTALFGLRIAVPVLTLAQIASNGGRVWLNRAALDRRLTGRFCLGAIPLAVIGALLLASAPLAGLQRGVGALLLAVVIWRRLRPHPRPPGDTAFVAVGAASGLGSALLGSVGPLTAPFFLARGLRRDAYVGTEAACALAMHLTKTAAYGSTDLLGGQVLTLGLLLVPATLVGTWSGKKVLDHVSDRVFVVLVEAGMIVAGLLFLVGI